MLPETFGRAVDKLACQGAAQFDMEGRVRSRASSIDAGKWRSGYQQQLAHRRTQLESMVAYAETPQCRMSALVRHFGDTAGASRPCGHCDFCSPKSALAQSFAEPTPHEERDLRRILRELRNAGSKSTGRLFSDAGAGSDRRQFDVYLDGLARAGLIGLSTETWTNPEGKEVTFRKASLTYEGRTLGEQEPLSVVLRASDGPAIGSPRKPRKKNPASRSDATGSAPAFTPEQTELEDRLRRWRKAEASAAGKPAFFVLTDAALRGVVLATPRNLSQLLEIHGVGPVRADRYGAAILALCSGRELSVE